MARYHGEKLGSLTIDQMLELLEDAKAEHGGSMQVIFTSNYGDYHRTMQALDISGQTEVVEVAESAYSNSGFSVVKEEDWEYDELGNRLNSRGEPVLDGEAETFLCIK